MHTPTGKRNLVFSGANFPESQHETGPRHLQYLGPSAFNTIPGTPSNPHADDDEGKDDQGD